MLLMSVFWKGTTTRGAFVGGFLGLISAVVMVVLSKAVWVATLGFSKELFPYDNPALFSMSIVVGIWVFSKMDTSQRAKNEIAGFNAHMFGRRPELGSPALTPTEWRLELAADSSPIAP